MTTEPWLVPDPAYVPTTPVGTESSIPCQLQVVGIVQDTATDSGWYYQAKIINELNGILGDLGTRIHAFPWLAVEQYTNVWSGGDYPLYRVGDTFTFNVGFKIEGVWREPDKENAFINEIKITNDDRLVEILGQHTIDMPFTCLAKGVDEYMAQPSS